MSLHPKIAGRVLVDPQDAHLLALWRWHPDSSGYVFRHEKVDGTPKEYLHRLIMKPAAGMVVDHINGDPLDNRRSNLRVCTRAQNNINNRRRLPKSGHRGVSWLQRDKRWTASINRIHLGNFVRIEDAIAAREKAVRELHGEFAPILAVRP